MTPLRLENAVQVGRGFTSDVYDWGPGRVLKLFHRGFPRHKAEREYRASQAVHALGLPVPQAHEFVEFGDRVGIVFERAEGPSLFDSVRAKPWTLFGAVKLLAELHALIHRCPAPAELPSLREWIAGGIDETPDLSPSDRQAARAALDNLPDGDTLCHGDFHPANVLLTPRGPVVIDWDTATRGHPLGDVACTVRLLRSATLPPWSPRYMHALLRCTRGLLHRSYLKKSLRLHGGRRSDVEAWLQPLAAARSWRHEELRQAVTSR